MTEIQPTTGRWAAPPRTARQFWPNSGEVSVELVTIDLPKGEDFTVPYVGSNPPIVQPLSVEELEDGDLRWRVAVTWRS